MGKSARDLSRTTKFDVDVLQPAEGNEELLGISNARQIARGPDGTWLVLLRRGRKQLVLRGTRKARPRGEDFAEEVLVVGDFQPAVFETTGRLRGMAGVAFDRKGRVHVFWNEGRKVHQAMFEAAGLTSLEPLKHYKSWSQRTLVCPGKNPALTDAVLDPDGWGWAVCTADDGIYVGRPKQGGEFRKACGPGRNARLALDPEGGMLMVFEVETTAPPDCVERVVCYLQSRDGETWTGADGKSGEPDVAAESISWRPSVACWRGRPLIVFQADGVKRANAAPSKYLRSREGGGSSIGFAHYDGAAWRRGWVAKAEEVLIKRIAPVAPEGACEGELLPQVEEKWRPALVTDAQGVPWAWWMDTTRRMAYWSRWLGERFGEPAEHGGPYCLPTEFLSAQNGAAERLGLVALADGRAIFDTAAAPALKAAEEPTVLMLDMLELAELSGLEPALEPMRKHEGNPVFSTDVAAGDGPRATAPIVIYDELRGRYCMRYLTDAGGWKWGYAESADGIAWDRVQTGGGGNRLSFVIPFHDNREPDPQRRYKGFLFEEPGGDPPVCAAMVSSADGLNWRVDEEVPAERLQLPFTEPWGVSYLDVAPWGDGEYKVIGRTWHDAGRALGMAGSVDLFRWHGAEAILDARAPDKRPPSPRKYAMGILESNAGPRDEDQIEYGFCHGPAGGVYLLFYAPCAYDGRYGLALATSRDGRHFARVLRGTPLVPCGEAGEWDNGFLHGLSFGGWPCRKGDEFRFYYGAAGWHRGVEGLKGRFRIGFASQIRDRWGCVQLKRDRDIGWLTTIPIDMADGTGSALHLNVTGLERLSGLERGGRVAAEFLDAETWTPIEGFTCADCLALEQDGLDVRVRWKDKRSLPRGRACGVRLRVVIEGWTPRLYALRFARSRE